jgi:hypothetical protein
MNNYESQVADDRGCKIAHAFRQRSSLEKLLLVLRDGIYVLLYVFRNLHDCPCVTCLDWIG